MNENGEPRDNEDEEALGGDGADRLIQAVIEREFGEGVGRDFAQIWRRQDEYQRRLRPDEGLRERKKRQTRQRISDVATALFVNRGFDAVTVAEIADKVGVSEKTIYNYFPTKESLVFDQTDEEMTGLAAALRDRAPGVSPTAAIVAKLKTSSARFTDSVEDLRLDFLPRFGAMVRGNAALRAAWAEHRNRLVDAITEILASEAGVDPGEPEPVVAARSLVSIVELLYESILRRIAQGLTGAALRDAIDGDLDRAARLLDTGLWSLHLMVEGRRTRQQLLDAATAAEQARQQVMSALRQAKQTWHDLRDEQRAVIREQRTAARGGPGRGGPGRARGRGRA